MNRLVVTLFIGLVAMLIAGFSFLAMTDIPVAQTEIVKSLPSPASR